VKTSVREERLLVVSDLHMGNKLHSCRRAFLAFVEFAIDNDYSICINGDGIDIAQLSFKHLTSELTPSLRVMPRLGEHQSIYYTVGNHDIVLEHFLSDIGGMKVVPFLTVYSGDQRIRVEHGHMYDDMFLRFPRTYYVFMAIGHLAILMGPRVYDAIHELNARIIAFAEWMFSGFGLVKREKEEVSNRIEGERECFREGAEAVGMRGFDAVVFGHTHLNGTVELAEGLKYYNTGAWFSKPHCVAIDHGRIWFGAVSDLVKHGDPFPSEPAMATL